MAVYDNFLQALSGETAMGVQNFFGTMNQNNPYAAINPYQYRGMSRRDAPADRLYADLIRAQTQDYLNRFVPIENELAASITETGTTFIDEDLERTRGAVLGSAQNVESQANRRMGRFGLYGDSGIADSNATISALVGGINDTYMRDRDRRDALLTGGLAALSQRARSRMG
ncbi:MAG: hypothetical protein VX004_04395 [SAR324 cluster bacterium]|nr:hypothetical protein [SAR324 cluster bacterium]